MPRYAELGNLFGRQTDVQFTPDQIALVKSCAEHPWNLLSAAYRGEPVVKTRDEQNPDRSQRVRPFPKDWAYVRALTELLYDPPKDEDGRYAPIVIPKARRMFISYCVCSFALWECMFIKASNWIIAKNDKDDALRLMREKIKATYDELPEFLRRLVPATFSESDRGYIFVNTGSSIAPAEAGFHSGSGLGVAASYFIDEAPMYPNLRTCYEKIQPTAALLVMCGTPPGADDSFDPDSLEFFASMFRKRMDFEEVDA